MPGAANSTTALRRQAAWGGAQRFRCLSVHFDRHGNPICISVSFSQNKLYEIGGVIIPFTEWKTEAESS